MNVLVIVDDQPYGSERPYNALRLARALAKREEVNLRVFLMGDAVACAIAGQMLPTGTTTSTACSSRSSARARSAAAAHVSTPADWETSN